MVVVSVMVFFFFRGGRLEFDCSCYLVWLNWLEEWGETGRRCAVQRRADATSYRVAHPSPSPPTLYGDCQVTFWGSRYEQISIHMVDSWAGARCSACRHVQDRSQPSPTLQLRGACPRALLVAAPAGVRQGEG